MCFAFFPFKFGGPGDLKGDIFQFSLVPIMLTIPPSDHFGWPKMVINFFGRRNFIQPMGRPKHTLNVPCIFSF